MIHTPFHIASLVVGPVQFDRPWWLLLIPVLGVACWWLSRRSLSGMAGWSRGFALAARILAIALLAGALAQAQTRRVTEAVGVTFVVDVSRSIPPGAQQWVDEWVVGAQNGQRAPDDLMGVVTVGETAIVQSSPGRGVRRVERHFLGGRDGSNLADGVRLAAAVSPRDAAGRVVLVSDGNETAGSLLRAAEQARALGVPVEVLAVESGHTDDVMVEDVQIPSGVRIGEPVSLRIVLNATTPVIGRLGVLEDGQPIDLDPEDPTRTTAVLRLDAGRQVISVPITPGRPGAYKYDVVYEPIAALDDEGNPLDLTGDAVIENNISSAVTFVSGEGATLVVSNDPEEAAPLLSALEAAAVRTVTVRSSELPSTLPELAAYEAVVLVNQSAYDSTTQQQELLRQYVHDTGGGLVMVGGPDTFGAGGWIGSPLADALPISLDPPQKRQMPMGALALVIDSSGSMSSSLSLTGSTQQQMANESAIAALQTLTSRDEGVVVSFSGSPRLVVPRTTLADMNSVIRQVRSISSGGGTNMYPGMLMAGEELMQSQAGVKHMIIVSDGHTTGSDAEGVRIAGRLRAAGITISVVSVGDGANDLLLSEIAVYGGGRWYQVRASDSKDLLPQIFMKEARTVRRALIWEGEPFSPALTGVPTETMRGISGVPPINGYVVAAEREGLSLVTLRGKEEDPIAAQWQHGLGRVVTFTSDASTRWAGPWVAWSGFNQFWEQHVRWAMRPQGNPVMRITTENRGDQTLVVVDALDPDGDRLNFVQFNARVATPDGEGAALALRQVGPGRYEGAFDSSKAGSYVVAANYGAPHQGGGTVEGAFRAAVTRSYPDEFRALGPNRPVLRQVAAITGGRVLTDDPLAADLWSREGMTMPVTLRPAWLVLLLAGVAVFLIDVGIRRVRIEPRAIGAWLHRSASKERERSTQATEAFRSVKGRRAAPVATQTPDGQPQRAVRFEAGADRAQSSEPVALSGEEEAPSPLKKPERPRVQDDEGPKDALSALRAARKRAQEDLQDRSNQPPNPG